MRLQKYSILQISARTIMNCAKKTEDGYRFIFGTDDEANQGVITRTEQNECALFRQLLTLVEIRSEPALSQVSNALEEALVYLDFSGIFDRRAVGRVKELQELAEWLFRPEGIELSFADGSFRFVAFERSASMSRKNMRSFVRADLYEPLWERMTLGMKISKCQLAKLYAYNGLMFTSGRVIEHGFHMDADHVIVVDNPRSIVPDVSTVTVEDDGTDAPMRHYTRVEKTADIEVLEFDGEGLVSAELGYRLDPYGYEKHDHHSFQIRMPFIKGMLHSVDYKTFLKEHGFRFIKDIYGTLHPVDEVEMILTKSMFKACKWFQACFDMQKRENFRTFKEQGETCRLPADPWEYYWYKMQQYGHTVYISQKNQILLKNEGDAGEDGIENYDFLNYQVLHTLQMTRKEMENLIDRSFLNYSRLLLDPGQRMHDIIKGASLAPVDWGQTEDEDEPASGSYLMKIRVSSQMADGTIRTNDVPNQMTNFMFNVQ